MVHFLAHGKDDNVAVAAIDIKAGEMCQLLNQATEKKSEIKALMDIPLGHKIALQDFKIEDTVIKYDNDIGRVIALIKKGEHVHIHNVKTKRW